MDHWGSLPILREMMLVSSEQADHAMDLPPVLLSQAKLGLEGSQSIEPPSIVCSDKTQCCYGARRPQTKIPVMRSCWRSAAERAEIKSVVSLSARPETLPGWRAL
jgi:hypothetical protein